MAGEGRFWSKFAEDVKTVSGRTTRGACRAVQMGVLRVDLISLRRDRSRALADLGERALSLWTGGAASTIEADPEALRIRERITAVDRDIDAKREEIDRLREEGRAESGGPDGRTPVVSGSDAP